MAIYIGIEDAHDVAAFGSHAVAGIYIQLITELVRSGEKVIFENRPINRPPSVAFIISTEEEAERWAADLLRRIDG